MEPSSYQAVPLSTTGDAGEDGEVVVALGQVLLDVEEEDEKVVEEEATPRSERCLAAAGSRVPPLSWVPPYCGPGIWGRLLADVVAGCTVGMTIIPQAIAYGFVAGLPPQYGLYSAFMPLLAYFLLGTCPKLSVGPTVLMAVMTAPHSSKSPAYAALLSFTTGILITLCGVLRLGFLVDFFSVPVVAGFVSAAAIIIASNQLRGLLGITGNVKSTLPGTLGTWHSAALNFNTAKVWDSLLGFLCILVLLLLRQLGRLNLFDKTTRSGRHFSKLVWFISIARNATVVVISASIAYVGDGTLVITGAIEPGLPSIGLNFFNATYINDTGELAEDGLQDMLSNLGSLIVLLPLVSVMDHMAIAKAFSSGSKQVDASQEMLALGTGNFLGSVVGGIPVTGSFSRSAVNAASGANSTLAGAITGLLVLSALAVLMPFCAYIPKATLAAVIITAVLFSVEFHVIKPMWKSKRTDLIFFAVTFFCCLFWALDYGILAGIVSSLLYPLAHTARPKMLASVKLTRQGIPVLYAKPDRGLLFPSVAHLQSGLARAKEDKTTAAVVLDCSCLAALDFTSANGIKEMLEEHSKGGTPLVLYCISPASLKVLRGVLDGEEGLLRTAANAAELDLVLKDLGEFNKEDART